MIFIEEERRLPLRFDFEELWLNEGVIKKETQRFARFYEDAFNRIAAARRKRVRGPLSTLQLDRFYPSYVYNSGIPPEIELVRHTYVQFASPEFMEWKEFPDTYERYAAYDIFFNRRTHGELGRVIIVEPKVQRNRLFSLLGLEVYGVFLRPLALYTSPSLPNEVLEHFLKRYVDHFEVIIGAEVEKYVS